MFPLSAIDTWLPWLIMIGLIWTWHEGIHLPPTYCYIILIELVLTVNTPWTWLITPPFGLLIEWYDIAALLIGPIPNCSRDWQPHGGNEVSGHCIYPRYNLIDLNQHTPCKYPYVVCLLCSSACVYKPPLLCVQTTVMHWFHCVVRNHLYVLFCLIESGK